MNLITALILAKTTDMDPDKAAELRKALEEDKRARARFLARRYPW